jgi:integrase
MAECAVSNDTRPMYNDAGVEIKNLHWRDVDLLRRSFTVRRSKNDDGLRLIPMNDDAYDAVLELWERTKAFDDTKPAHFLFPTCEQGHIDPERCPGQLVQDGAQSDEAPYGGCRSQRPSLCAHARHPSKALRIAAQLFEADNATVFGAEIDKEAAHRDVVVAFGGRT